jgi:hypothetical protein
MSIKIKLENESSLEVADIDYTSEQIEQEEILIMRKNKDWRLPSIKELKLIFNNIHKKGNGSFRNDWYWSQESLHVSWDCSVNLGFNFNDGTVNAEVLGNGATRMFNLSKAYVRLVRTVSDK